MPLHIAHCTLHIANCSLLIANYFTTTRQETFFPLYVSTLIIAVPLLLAVIKPLLSTVHTFVSVEVKVLVFDAELPGTCVASLKVFPTVRLTRYVSRVICVAGCLTVTLQVAFLPLYVFTVIVAVPIFLPVTVPFALTSHIPLSLDVKVLLFEAVPLVT